MSVEVRVGLPYLPSRRDHVFLATLAELGASSLISAGSLYRPATGWRRAPLTWGPAMNAGKGPSSNDALGIEVIEAVCEHLCREARCWA